MDKIIYLDSAATTPLCPAAKKVIVDNLDDFYNVNSSYEPARKLRIKVEEAREYIAEIIGAKSTDEIYFTSGGSEANNWVLTNKFSLISDIEHSSVIGNINFKVDEDGLVNLEKFKQILEEYSNGFYPPIEVISTMMVNNEIGVIEPIREMVEMIHETPITYREKTLFHTDAVQAVGHIPVNVQELGVDMLSASGHKFGAIKGIGFVYIKNGIDIDPLIYGTQERKKRGGTTNALGVLTMESALRDSIEHLEERNEYIKKLRDKLLNELLSINGVKLNGSYNNRVVSNINVCIDEVNSQQMVAMCDSHGIMISSGSACHENEENVSHVLTGIGLSDEEAKNSIRITLSHLNTIDEIDYCCKIMPKIIERLRQTY